MGEGAVLKGKPPLFPPHLTPKKGPREKGFPPPKKFFGTPGLRVISPPGHRDPLFPRDAAGT